MAESFFLHFLSSSLPLAYIVIFLGMVFEGDILLFTVAFLAQQGVFNPFQLVIVVLAGVLAGDYGWYLVGVRIVPKFSRLARWVEHIAQPIDQHLTNRQLRTITISKFAYSIHHPILMRAGILRLDAKKLMQNDVVASFVWIAVVGGLGYFSSLSVGLFRHYIKYAEIGLLIGLVLFLAISYLGARYARKGI